MKFSQPPRSSQLSSNSSTTALRASLENLSDFLRSSQRQCILMTQPAETRSCRLPDSVRLPAIDTHMYVHVYYRNESLQCLHPSTDRWRALGLGTGSPRYARAQGAASSWCSPVTGSFLPRLGSSQPSIGTSTRNSSSFLPFNL